MYRAYIQLLIFQFRIIRILFKSKDELVLEKVKGDKLVRMFINRRFKKAITYINLDQPRKIIGTTTFSKPSHHSLRYPNLNKIQTFFVDA